MKTKFIFLTVLSLLTTSSFSQRDVTTFGLVYRPIVPNRIIGTYDQQFNEEIFSSTAQQTLGHNFGMVIRQGITDVISIETGFSFIQRNFDLNYSVEDSGYADVGNVGAIAYQVPLSGLVFIRLGENLYMNTAIGAGLDYYPSDVTTSTAIQPGEFFLQEGARRYRFSGSLLANIGFEYRTKKSGYFYLGSSYNLPFAPVYTFAMSYEFKGGDHVALENIRGSYLTLDFRYYFHEKPRSEQKRKRK